MRFISSSLTIIYLKALVIRYMIEGARLGAVGKGHYDCTDDNAIEKYKAIVKSLIQNVPITNCKGERLTGAFGEYERGC